MRTFFAKSPLSLSRSAHNRPACKHSFATDFEITFFRTRFARMSTTDRGQSARATTTTVVDVVL